ncbi:hypothetical protein [uncultured Brevibacillus sp.]|uniref:hypothetical protein n=1 Tax=uncultured Brevibacillus sp. TaxID=169970 RepID=UPI0025963793|nr:hypothetical protein [uncultured Brevibacillus sp.]
MNGLEKRIDDLCGEMIQDLRPRCIVDRNKFDELYKLIQEMSNKLSESSNINRGVVGSILLVLFQLNTQTKFAKEESLPLISSELEDMFINLLDSGLFEAP